MSDAATAMHSAEQLSGKRLLGRALDVEYSSYSHEEAVNLRLLHPFDADNLRLAGVSTKLLLSNLKQAARTSDVRKFLQAHLAGDGLQHVRDVYVVHNLVKVCAGKCFVEFADAEQAQRALSALHLKLLLQRSVCCEYGHVKDEKHDEGHDEDLRGRTKRLFMSNLAWDTEEKHVKRLFGSKLRIESVHLNVAGNGFPTGSCFVRCESAEAAAKAHDQGQGKKLMNRVVRLEFEKESVGDGSYGTHDNELW